ncbi:hypothetical protein Bca4012_002786 [Brassica carinata]
MRPQRSLREVRDVRAFQKRLPEFQRFAFLQPVSSPLRSDSKQGHLSNSRNTVHITRKRENYHESKRKHRSRGKEASGSGSDHQTPGDAANLRFSMLFC